MKYYVIISGLTAMASMLLGFYAGKITVMPFHEIEPIVEINQPVPLIHLTNIIEGKLIGRIEGNARMFARTEISVRERDGTFTIPLADLGITSSKVEPIIIPDGSKFVASKSGKIFYPVNSASANRISPKNRIYFKTVEEAIRAGYRSS